MRIAQVAPLAESVPPKFYGGTERVVSYLTEELVRRGHEVTLFASGDSHTQAKLVAPCPTALRMNENYHRPEVYNVLLLESVLKHAEAFDVIHFHTEYTHLPLSTRLNIPCVTTLHGRLDIPDLEPLFKQFPQAPVISISDAQRQPLQWLNWQKTIYHGVPEDLYALHKTKGDYLAFIGRISPEKRVDRAIRIAKQTQLPLKIAAKIDPFDKEYFEQEVVPQLKAPDIEFVGEISEQEKNDFLGNAAALLFPIDWPEPFGLVMIEAFACGTPVIAYPNGSVPEVMKDGVSGFVVDSIDQAVAAVKRLDRFDRQQCRQYFEQRFSVSHMTDNHLALYQQLISSTKSVRPLEQKYSRSQGDSGYRHTFPTPDKSHRNSS